MNATTPPLFTPSTRPAPEPPPRSAREEVDRLADEIGSIAGQVAAATHRLLACVRRFDLLGGWAAQGALSCAHWLSWRIGLDPCAAREKVRVARALGSLPRIDDALRRGLVSYSKVRALTRVATPETEGTLLDLARSATASQLERICRSYGQALAADARAPGPERGVRWRELEGGMTRIELTLPRDEAAVVWRALDAALPLVAGDPAGTRGRVAGVAPTTALPGSGVEPMHATAAPPAEGAADPRVPDGPRGSCSRLDSHGGAGGDVHTLEAAAPPPENDGTPGELGGLSRGGGGGERAGVSAEAPIGREHAGYVSTPLPPGSARADAAVAVCEAFLARGAPASVPGRFEVMLHVDGAALRDEPSATRCCELEDGTPLAPETARRLACDAALVEVGEDGQGRLLDVGRRRRTIPSALRRALRLRDGGCRFPGCTNRVFVDGHHVRHWAHGGATRLDNLVLLCRRHHRLVHEGGFRVEVTGERLRFLDPQGRELLEAPALGVSRPPPLGVTVDPVGLRATSLTALDLGLATSLLLEDRARRVAP